MRDNRYLLRTAQENDLPAIIDFEIEIARISFPDDAIVDPAIHHKKLAKALERDREACWSGRELSNGRHRGLALGGAQYQLPDGRTLRNIPLIGDQTRARPPRKRDSGRPAFRAWH